MLKRTITIGWLAILAVLATGRPAAAHHGIWQPYVGNPSPVAPAAGPILPTPDQVPNKQVSMAPDRDYLGLPEPERVVEWDGLGGVQNGFRYGGLGRVDWVDPEGDSIVDGDLQVDALANRNDALVSALLQDRAALLFVVERGGPQPVDGGQIRYVRPTMGDPTAVPDHGIWAQPHEIDAAHPPIRIDGLEMWDESPPFGRAYLYSLVTDPIVDFPATWPKEKVSIWEYDPSTGKSAPLEVNNQFVLTKHLLGAIDLYFTGVGVGGPVYANMWEYFDLNAMIVGDDGETILFSIAPVALGTMTQDPTLPDFHGGEIFVYRGATTPIGFLEMGGYRWDYNLDLMAEFGTDTNNITALEVVAVPEPSSLVLLALGGAALALLARRRRRAPA
jgi:hypothetical protein